MSARARLSVLAPLLAVLLGACGDQGTSSEGNASPELGPQDTRRASEAGSPTDAARQDAAPPDAAGADTAPFRDALPGPDAPSAPDASPHRDAPADAHADTTAPSDGLLSADALPPDAGPSDRTAPVFDPGRLHIVDITVAEADLRALEENRENRVPCDLTYDGIDLPRSGIRQKGGIGSVSSLNAKPGFSVKFDEFVDGQDLYSLEKLVLNNCIQDPTFLHEHMGYELARQLGIPASRTAHALVRLNGYAYGLYVVAEAVDRDFLRRSFGEDQDEGNLYEGPCCADFVFDIPHMELKDEDEGRSRDDLIALADVVRDTSDDRFPAEVEARLDLRNFILDYALDAAVWHWDGYAFNVNNHYLYHLPRDDRFVILPHGMDQLFQDLNFDPMAWPNGRLAQRVREIPAYNALYRGALHHIATDVWDVEAMSTRIDAVRRVVAQAPRGEPAVDRDVRQFEENLRGTLEAYALRKEVLLTSLEPVCGNGMLQEGEGCDDGNRDAGDGCGPDCQPEACFEETFRRRRYLFCSAPQDFAAGEAECAARGGTLAFPANADEQDFLWATARAHTGGDLWIGVDDRAEEGRWSWPDGSPAAFTAWGADRPNGTTDQNCVFLDPGLDGGWNDRACDEQHGIVCRLP